MFYEIKDMLMKKTVPVKGEGVFHLEDGTTKTIIVAEGSLDFAQTSYPMLIMKVKNSEIKRYPVAISSYSNRIVECLYFVKEQPQRYVYFYLEEAG